MKTSEIREFAELLLETWQPEALEKPMAVDLRKIVEVHLPKFGVRMYAVDEREIPGCEATTRHSRPGEFDILLRRDFEEHFYTDGRIAHRSRATVAHEVGHALLHRDLLTQMAGLNRPQTYRRKDLRREEDPEAQAWELARALLVPPWVVRAYSITCPKAASKAFWVSEALAQRALRTIFKGGQ